MASKGRRGRRMSIDPDSGFVRPLPLPLEGEAALSRQQAEGSVQQPAELPGLVPEQSGTYQKGAGGADQKAPGAGDQESDWYQQPLPESVDHGIPDIGKACARAFPSPP